MPALLDATSMISCTHGARCTHTPSQQRVTLNGIPALTVNDLNTVAACSFTLPNGTPSPCVTVQWIVPATRVTLTAQPALLQSSVGLCKAATQAPQGTPIVSSVQTRAQGT